MDNVLLGAAAGANIARNLVYTEANVTSSDECFICMQTYRPFNPSGCHPIKLKPCGHVVGQECLEAWNATIPDGNCLLCRRKVATAWGWARISDEVLLWFSRSVLFQLFDDVTLELHKEDNPRDTFKLRAALIRGEITNQDRYRLMSDVIRIISFTNFALSLLYLAGIPLIVIGAQGGFAAVEYGIVGYMEWVLPHWAPPVAAFFRVVGNWIFGEGSAVWRLVTLRPIGWIFTLALLGTHAILHFYVIFIAMALCLLGGRR